MKSCLEAPPLPLRVLNILPDLTTSFCVIIIKILPFQDILFFIGIVSSLITVHTEGALLHAIYSFKKNFF